MKHKFGAMLACIGMGLGESGGAGGSNHAFAAAPDPADANVAIPAADYRSPFAGYRPLGEDNTTAWKDANDTVGKIGGWRAYAREAADAMKAREAADAMTTRKAPGATKSDPPAPSQPPAAPIAPSAQTHKHGG